MVLKWVTSIFVTTGYMHFGTVLLLPLSDGIFGNIR